MDALSLEYDFLALLPSFLLLFLSPSYRYASFLRVPSSVQQSSATAVQQVVHVLLSFVSCLISEFLLFFVCSVFFVVPISWLACCALVPGA